MKIAISSTKSLNANPPKLKKINVLLDFCRDLWKRATAIPKLNTFRDIARIDALKNWVEIKSSRNNAR
jgi:hypothetical protein